MTEYGYIRVSSKDQNEDRQVLALQSAGVSPSHFYMDKQSGKDFNRPAYRRLLRRVKKGDVIFIKSIDRLGRNYDEIIDQWRHITKEIHADIVVLDMPLLDTRRRGQDLTGAFISDMVLQILSYVAETERKNIRERQREGIAAAKARGVVFGRRKKPLPQDFVVVAEKWRKKELTCRQALEILQIGRTYFYKNIKELSL